MLRQPLDSAPTYAGFPKPPMGPGDRAASDRKVVIRRTSFGKVVREYEVQVAGAITTLQGNRMVEPGTCIGNVLSNGLGPAWDVSGCDDEEGEPIE